MEHSFAARVVGRFKFLWTDTAQMTLGTHSIVEGNDVIGHVV